MKTPRERYLNDANYHALVNHLESFIELANYTPSELREACILACINYESKKFSNVDKLIKPEVIGALKTLEDYTNTECERQYEYASVNYQRLKIVGFTLAISE